MTDTEIDRRIQEILEERGYAACPECGRHLDRGDIAWNGAITEAGTDHCFVEIQCQQCDAEVVSFYSWYPGIESLDELVYVLDEDLESK